MHVSRRLAFGLLVAIAAVAVAIVADGLLSTMLGLIAVLVIADALVPDLHTPLFRELPASKRRRLRDR
jgi:Na+(H+)/acetate symporter ActP